MGVPLGGWNPVAVTRPPQQERHLCTEIERVGRNVWICKLFYRHGPARGRVFQRVVVDGNRAEAQRVMEAMYELQKIKEEG